MRHQLRSSFSSFDKLRLFLLLPVHTRSPGFSGLRDQLRRLVRFRPCLCDSISFQLSVSRTCNTSPQWSPRHSRTCRRGAEPFAPSRIWVLVLLVELLRCFLVCHNYCFIFLQHIPSPMPLRAHVLRYMDCSSAVRMCWRIAFPCLIWIVPRHCHKSLLKASY